MKSAIEHRKSKRFEHIATVMLKDESAGYFFYGKMINYSEGGLLIVSDTQIQHGSKINITLDKPVFKVAPQTYDGNVKWCKEMSNTDMRDNYGRYGIGIKYA
jgi:hypothetical protein